MFAGCLTEAGETELSKSCSSRMQPVSLDVSKPDSVRGAFDIVKAKLPPGKGLAESKKNGLTHFSRLNQQMVTVAFHHRLVGVVRTH